MENKEKRYTMKEVKLFLENEINPVIKESGLDVELKLMTKAEYFNSDIYKNYCKMGFEDYANNYLSNYLAFRKDKNLVILLENNKLEVNDGEQKNVEDANNYTKEEIISLLITAFHELGHFWQNNKDNYDNYFNLFCESIEYIVMNDSKFYNSNWDKFYSESEADLYGLSMTMEILKKYPHLYEGNEEWLNDAKDIFECRINTYDFNLIFSKFNMLDKRSYSNVILSFIYKNNMQDFNSIETISCNLKKWNFIEGIVPILSSDAFLNTIDINSLNDNEISIMIDVLNEAYYDILAKIEILNDYLENYNDDKFYFKRSYFNDRLDRLDNILKKFNNIKQEKKNYTKKL